MTCSWFDIGQWSEYKRAIEYMDKYGEWCYSIII
jgi:hypothetical protein